MTNPGSGCPFCQSTRVTAVAVEGLDGDLIAFRCETCHKRWSESIRNGKAGTRRASALERDEP